MIIKPLEDGDTAVVERRAQPNPSHFRKRSDVRTRAIVDKALELQGVIGTSVAAGLLANQKVPYSVAERVLSNPRRRRKA